MYELKTLPLWIACYLDSYLLVQEGSKEWKRCEAKIRRMVTPSKRTGNVATSPEILKRWECKGGPRKDLIRMMVKCDGIKDPGNTSLFAFLHGLYFHLLDN